MCILTRHLYLRTIGRQSSHHYYKKFIKINNITIWNENQVKQEGGTGTGLIRTGY